MSVTTSADESLTAARSNVRSAIHHLNSILIDEEWGYDEFSDEFTKEMHAALIGLVRVKSHLG